MEGVSDYWTGDDDDVVGWLAREGGGRERAVGSCWFEY